MKVKRKRATWRRARLVLAAAIVLTVVVVVPEAWAAGTDVGKNLGDLLRHYASEIYAGVLAIISLTFLLNRRYSELGMFLLAAVVVGWLVFSPDQVAHAARAIAHQILG